MYEYIEEVPAVDEYLELRKKAGLSPRSSEAAFKGLPNSLFAISVKHEGRAVGMGRVVGDGGCNFEIVDVVVDPDYQGQGVGRKIMEYIMGYLEKQAAAGSYISLIADVPELYEKFGFKKCSPKSDGMYIRK